MGVSSCSVIGDFWPVVHRESRILRVGSDPWNNACRASCTHPFVVHRATFSEENTKNVNFPGAFAPLDLPLILKLSSYRTHETTSTVIDSHSLGLVIVVNIQGGFVPPGPTSYTETNKTIWLAAWSTTTVICSHSLSSVIFVNFPGGFATLDPPLILKLTKLFTWLHDPLLVIYSHSLALVIFVNIPGAYTWKAKNA